MITREKVKALQVEINAAIQDIAEKHGVALRVGNASFNNSNAAIKIEVNSIDGGEVVTKEKSDFLLYADYLGINKDAIGKNFIFRGKPFKFIGYMPRSTKYPFLAESPDGKSYKLPMGAKEILKSL